MAFGLRSGPTKGGELPTTGVDVRGMQGPWGVAWGVCKADVRSLHPILALEENFPTNT